MRGFKCPDCDFDPGEHAWSHIALRKHKWEVHKTPGASGFNSKRVYYPDKETWDEYQSKLKEAKLFPVLSLIKRCAEEVRTNLDLSKSQLFWLTMGIGLVLGYALAVLVQP